MLVVEETTGRQGGGGFTPKEGEGVGVGVGVVHIMCIIAIVLGALAVEGVFFFFFCNIS